MIDRPVEPAGPPARPETCAHRWLRIVCGECGEPVDILGLDIIRPPALSVDITGEGLDSPKSPGEVVATLPPGDRGAIFVVARGHVDLVEQLRTVLGQSADIQIIEDRRRSPRDPVAPEESAPAGRVVLRKRVLEDELGDPGDPPVP